MQVLAFHGQGSSPARMRYDCGNPDWITCYPDWQKYSGAELAEAYRHTDVVLIGYSLGGEFIAELTHTALAARIRGIVVYESPCRTVAPQPLPCPVKIIWNDYEPWFRWRKQKKANSIRRWTQAFPKAERMKGKLKSHIETSRTPPFFRQAWDKGLNAELGGWVDKCAIVQTFQPA